MQLALFSTHIMYLSASVQARGILCSKEYKARMSFDSLLGFCNEEFSVVIQKSIECF